MEFFKTVMGRQFYEGTMRKKLETIAIELEKSNELKKEELEFRKNNQKQINFYKNNKMGVLK